MTKELLQDVTIKSSKLGALSYSQNCRFLVTIGISIYAINLPSTRFTINQITII